MLFFQFFSLVYIVLLHSNQVYQIMEKTKHWAFGVTWYWPVLLNIVFKTFSVVWFTCLVWTYFFVLDSSTGSLIIWATFSSDGAGTTGETFYIYIHCSSTHSQTVSAGQPASWTLSSPYWLVFDGSISWYRCDAVSNSSVLSTAWEKGLKKVKDFF